jgi:hypothetical protein
MIAAVRQNGKVKFKSNRRIQMIDVRRITPSPENFILYRQRRPDEADFGRLKASIAANGVQAPLLITTDGNIISGNQRHAAAIEAGLDEVPCIVLDVRRSDFTQDEWIALLREHNCGREKTLDERVREALIDINPQQTLNAVVDDLVKRASFKSKAIYVPPKVKTRSEITSQTRGFADAIIGILTDVLGDSHPVPERAIHYHLLNLSEVRTSIGKRGFFYGNNKESSRALSRMLTRLRLCGEVPWDWICDETRPLTSWQVSRDAAEFIKDQTEGIYKGFARDLLQSQSAYYEILLEKLTIKGFIERVAGHYTMQAVTLRGNSSIDARYRLVDRFRASGKKFLRLFVLADCDPAGDCIAESTIHSLRDEFGINPDCIEAVRVAMLHEQADEHGLTDSIEGFGIEMKSKQAKALKDKFMRDHGRSDCYELEAVPPDVLAGLLDKAIRANIDIDLYNREVELQNVDNAEIAEVRRKALMAMRGGAG